MQTPIPVCAYRSQGLGSRAFRHADTTYSRAPEATFWCVKTVCLSEPAGSAALQLIHADTANVCARLNVCIAEDDLPQQEQVSSRNRPCWLVCLRSRASLCANSAQLSLNPCNSRVGCRSPDAGCCEYCPARVTAPLGKSGSCQQQQHRKHLLSRLSERWSEFYGRTMPTAL